MWFHENKNRKICPTTGKTIYATEDEAWESLKHFSKQVSEYEGSAYYCFYCENYHFGRNINKKIKKSRKRK